MSGRRLPALFIGLRYLLAKRDNRFIAFTSLISMAGLTLGVLALVLVLSVFNGSHEVMRERALITVPHADIEAKPRFTDWRRAQQLVASVPGIMATAPYTEIEALLSGQGYHQVTRVRGIDPVLESQVSRLDESLLEGSLSALRPGERGIVLGRALANNLRLFMGSAVNLVVPQANQAGTRLNLVMHRFVVVGISDVRFSVGADLAYIHLADSAALLGLQDPASAVRLRLQAQDVDRAGALVQKAVDLLEQEEPGPLYLGKDWATTEASLFGALRLEKLMTWLMLMMIVGIGAFNIISTLVMVVAEKQPDIAILRTMGASRHTILMVFLVQGTTVGVLGVTIGAFLGSLLALNFTPLMSALDGLLGRETLYVLSALPARWQLADVVITSGVALLISFLATLYPAWRASRIHPAQVLRHA
ncbi:MAG: lipoprotein-releasing ABC transporter permease subunit [Pseudohongiellaceae bacterium]|jgi:lipoprotein-releasing system permease protein